VLLESQKRKTMQIYPNNLSAARVIPPARLINDELEALKISKENAAQAFGLNNTELEELLQGTRSITPQIAAALENMGSSPANLWLQLQASYETHPKRGGTRVGAGRKREHLQTKQVRITAPPETMQLIETWLAQQNNAARALAELITTQVKT
jgi:addiction module HigA family antidote